MSAAVYQEPEPEDDRSIQEITQTDYSRPWSPRMMELIAKAKADLADMKKSGGEVLRTASTCVPSLSLLSCHTPTVAVHASLVYVLREREREREMGEMHVYLYISMYICVDASKFSHSALTTPGIPSP